MGKLYSTFPSRFLPFSVLMLITVLLAALFPFSVGIFKGSI